MEHAENQHDNRKFHPCEVASSYDSLINTAGLTLVTYNLMNIKAISATLIFVLAFLVAGFAQDQQSAVWNHKQFAVALTYDDGLNVHLDKVIPVLDSKPPFISRVIHPPLQTAWLNGKPWPTTATSWETTPFSTPVPVNQKEEPGSGQPMTLTITTSRR